MSGTFQHRVGVLAELPDLLRVLGVDPERTASGAGIEPELLQDTECRLPFGADSGKRRTAEAGVARYWAVATPSHRVGRSLTARVLFGKTSVEELAGELQMHPRTLSRRLQNEGTDFRNEAIREIMSSPSPAISRLRCAAPQGSAFPFHQVNPSAPRSTRRADAAMRYWCPR
jgi:hypothetical protein